MSDQKPPEPAIDLTNYVPKAEFEQAKTEAASLKDEISKVKMELLSPEYIEFKTKAKTPQQPAQAQPGTTDLTPLQQELGQLRNELTILRLNQEWETTSKKFPELDTYKEKIQKLYETTGNSQMTYEQAFKLVKAYEADEKKPEEKGKAPAKTFATEKPSGSVPFQAVEKKSFKNTDEANVATINELRDKYPGLGDTL